MATVAPLGDVVGDPGDADARQASHGLITANRVPSALGRVSPESGIPSELGGTPPVFPVIISSANNLLEPLIILPGVFDMKEAWKL